jgi:hypothetical protein
MKLGSKEHKAQFCEELIKTYYENIWHDEMFLADLKKNKGSKEDIKTTEDQIKNIWPARIKMVEEYLKK